MLPIRTFTKKPGSQQSGKCAGKGRISFLQQVFPVSLFTSGQCKQKMKTKLQNWKTQLQIESVHVSHFPTLSGWNAPRYASVNFKKLCQWNTIFSFNTQTNKQTNNILIWQLLNSLIFHSSQTAKRWDILSYLWAKCISLLIVPHILLWPSKVLRKLFYLGKKIKLSFFFFNISPNAKLFSVPYYIQVSACMWWLTLKLPKKRSMQPVLRNILNSQL